MFFSTKLSMSAWLSTVIIIYLLLPTAVPAWAEKHQIGAEAMEFPAISDEARSKRLDPPQGSVRMVLDTDTFNEIDDQFAVVYALLSPERLNVEALYAAPFHNSRSTGPGDGMEKSYEEILRLLDRLDRSPEGFVYRGSTEFLQNRQDPEPSEAALDLIRRAMAPNSDRLYVVAVGAITNVASAILIEPAITERIVVVWLGGHAQHWPDTREFNLRQDPRAAHVVLDSGVPLMRVPCQGMASHLLTTLPELEQHLQGRNRIADYLIDIFRDYSKDHYAWAKVLWDVSAIAWLVNEEWVPSALCPSPILTDELKWDSDASRHIIREATFVSRNPIFRDLFQKVSAY